MPKKHADLSASGSHRWIACPPSVRLEEQFPKEESIYAVEGTAAHELCELEAGVKLDLISLDKFVSEKNRFLESTSFYNQEMQECADRYAAFVQYELNERKKICPDAFAELEVRLDFSKWVPDGFGTGDCIIVSDGTLEVIDFKYGKGVKVEAENNSQMMLYALGAYTAYSDLYDIDTVKMTIFQPRISGISSWETDLKDLLKWAKDVVKPAAKLAAAGEGEFNPSEETCRFCRAKARCRARNDKNAKLFDESPDPLLITPDEAGEILKKAGDIEAWLKDLKETVSTTLLRGEKVEGWKLVEGRSTRKITDELKAVGILEKAGYPEAVLYERKLLSLTGLEGVVGKKRLGELLAEVIEKPKGAPTLALFTDKRPEWIPEKAILEAFDETDDSN